ncbi:hypothetical protein [Sphingomonas sp. UNC305MFCol5.2]|uniref:hypothetical protein n=1 Tax=Sphingomonas sp. UNC305MFCol5.2 TaxID=1449076 RepID=UPI00040FA101|nr:hypothetical protein [Sphingomonas sp. UNC305MFCol5.2]
MAGISSAEDFIKASVKQYLISTYSNPPVRCDEEVDQKLGWVPSISCPVNNQLMLIEASEKPYPEILRMRRAEMVEVPAPIAAYAACPEEAYTQNQKEATDLMLHGFGLFTVDAAGNVTAKFPAIPIAQHIPESQFKDDVDGLPALHKRQARECFELYKHNAPAGVASLAERVEGLIMRAGKDAAKRGWITKAQAKASAANVLVSLQGAPQFNNADTVLSAVRMFVQRYRNVAHHVPKDKKSAYRKYRDCRHAFLDGLRNMRDFKDAMKSLGLSGGF